MEGTAHTSVRPSTPHAPPPSPASLAARAAASYVRSTPNVDEASGLSAKGLAALHRLETNLAWEQL